MKELMDKKMENEWTMDEKTTLSNEESNPKLMKKVKMMKKKTSNNA
jgi:hypothetical protein